MNISQTQKLTLGAMAAALTVLMLYASYAVPYIKFACLFLSSVFVYSLLCEGLYGWSILVFLVSAAVDFLIVPEKLYWALYVGLFGHYSIFKCFIDEHIPGILLRSALKLFYCNIFALIGILIIKFLLMLDLPQSIQFGGATLPIWLAVIAVEVLFIIYDWALTLCVQMYKNRIRPLLVPKR